MAIIPYFTYSFMGQNPTDTKIIVNARIMPNVKFARLEEAHLPAAGAFFKALAASFVVKINFL